MKSDLKKAIALAFIGCVLAVVACHAITPKKQKTRYDWYNEQHGPQTLCANDSCATIRQNYYELACMMVLIENHTNFTSDQCRQIALMALTNTYFKGWYCK